MSERDEKINGLSSKIRYALNHQVYGNDHSVVEMKLLREILELIESPIPVWTPCAEGLPTFKKLEPGKISKIACQVTVLWDWKRYVAPMWFCGTRNSGKDKTWWADFKSDAIVTPPEAWKPFDEPYNPDTAKIDPDDVSQWPEWKQRAALSNYQFGNPDHIVDSNKKVEDADGAKDKRIPPVKWCCGKPPIARFVESEVGLSRAFHTIKCQVCHSGVQVNVENYTDEAYDAAFKNAVELWNEKVQHRPAANPTIVMPEDAE